MVGLQARLRPLNTLPQFDFGFYTRAQREVRGADLDVRPEWRPEQSWIVHTAWLNAILEGHTRVSLGLHIDAPVCTLLSARSAVPTRWSDELTRADTVLVVDDVARKSLRLGESVTVERIPGALHDVFLSRADARDIAYERLDRWVMGCLGTKRLPLSPGTYD
jgi:alpha-beta hydrolase superfamily lysophospholipase